MGVPRTDLHDWRALLEQDLELGEGQVGLGEVQSNQHQDRRQEGEDRGERCLGPRVRREEMASDPDQARL